ncbi:acyl-CoA dehydrogenase [Loktanella sp. 5RATIMAR09]|uniref:acyl-CoA dehydrogenase family protein n=1 Tax=Loktanella sp. 5RATIMAR09 TaxID=1225655 RepID=UPI0006EBB238|nr:acyl-CoA dehydrogenase family protein [Loktanella sp. 5RATIMAR09]KQI72932.1 acyl-CoA dehydrogenase [Loktanella sp. 5RATIMAR09]
MTAFKAPTEDILFSLTHVAQANRLDDWDAELAGDILGHFAGFAEGVIAPLNAVGDRQHARLINGRVRMPEGFGAAYAQLASDGWQGLTAPERFGGMNASPLIAAAVSEVFSGANHALQMVCNLVPGAITTLLKYGSPTQQDHWIPKLTSGDTLSTMCLTEAQAGSDLSAIRCRAEDTGDGWKITGEKIFISGGDQDMSANILHLVLARSGPADAGVKGLSLYLCPAQAQVSVTRIEDKMGLHASPTCQLRFDGASAELIGAEGQGLAAMFTLMNHARIDVALQGVAHASRAAEIAAAYATERTQGRQADGVPAQLHHHADVQRMLDEQRRLAMGARAMCHIALVELARNERPALGDFLTPLCKVFGSEAGIRAADLGIQILGGYGYLTEYGLDQIWRDARICAIYEGANGIHARSIATRGLRAGGGADEFAELISELAHGSETVLARLDAWQAFRAEMSSTADPLPRAHAFAQETAQLFCAAAWSRIAHVADHHHAPRHLLRVAQSAH